MGEGSRMGCSVSSEGVLSGFTREAKCTVTEGDMM